MESTEHTVDLPISASNFTRISFVFRRGDRTTFAATRHVLWALQFTKNAFAAEPQPQMHFGVF